MPSHLGTESSEPLRVSRRGLLKFSASAAAAAAIGVSLAACAPASSTPAGTGAATQGAGSGNGPTGTINAVVGYGSDQSWDPSQTASAFIMAAEMHIFEGLVFTDPATGKASPALATALPDDETATTWTFSLRDGATFHNGNPVTADDVVYSFQRTLDKTTLLNSFFAGWLTSVDKKDDKTVTFTLAYAFPLGVPRLGMVRIVPKGADWDAMAKGTPSALVGSGPYKVTGNTLGTSTEFTAFDKYNGPFAPNFQKMTWFSITDENARVSKVLSGAALVTDNVPFSSVSALEGAGMTVKNVSGMNNVFIMFNTKQKPFDDPRVRQALLYAIDVAQVSKVGLGGFGVQPKSFLPESIGLKPASTVFEHNVAKAKELLKAAGVPEGFTINIMATDTSYVVSALNVIQQNLTAVGLKVTLQPQATSALFTKMDQDASYQVVVASGNPQAFGADPDLLIRYNYTKGGLWMKYTNWSDSAEAAKVFTAMDTAAKETDAAKRDALMQKTLDLLADNAVLYPIVFVDVLTGWYKDKVTGVVPMPFPGLDLLKASLV